MSLRLGNQILKQQRTSPIVVQHVKQLLMPIQPRYTRGEYTVSVNTVADPHDREYRTFWRYQSFFTLEFVKALCESLPRDVEFVRYDHLTNTLTLNKL
jgi:hypothetical protein